MIIQPSFGGCLLLRIAIPIEKNRPSAVAFVIELPSPLIKPFSIDMRQRAVHRKTAEERFHMLARGRLAYPVTPMRTQLPPKSGCRERFAYGYKESAPRIAPRGAS